jgi:hypothetical protein
LQKYSQIFSHYHGLSVKSFVLPVIHNSSTNYTTLIFSIVHNTALVSSHFSFSCSFGHHCSPQLFVSAWIGWFPVLFYTSVYIGELHKRTTPAPSPFDLTAIRLLEAEATRLGSRALLFNSLLALAANVALPYFVKGAAKKGGRNTMIRPSTPRRRGPWWTLGLDLEKFQVHLASLWAASHLIFALCMGATL